MSRIFNENVYDDESDTHLVAMCVANGFLYLCDDDMNFRTTSYDPIEAHSVADLVDGVINYMKENNREDEAYKYSDYMRGSESAKMSVTGNKLCVASKYFVLFAEVSEEVVTILNFLFFENGGFKVALGEKNIVTSDEGVINIWSLDGKRLKQLLAHNKRITALATNNNMIISASEDSTLKCRSVDGFFLKSISTSTKIVHLELQDSHFISYGIDKKITIWSQSDYSIVNEKTFDNKITALSSSELLLATADKLSSTVTLHHKLKGTEIDTITSGHYVYDSLFIEDGKKLLILSEKHHVEADDEDSDDEDSEMQWLELWDISSHITSALELDMTTEDLIALVWKTLRDPKTDIATTDTRYSAKYLKFGELPDNLKERVKDDIDGGYNCPIMGSTLKDNTIVALTDCSHIMSEKGIKGWLERGNDTCPVCRQAPGVLKRLSRKQRLMEKILNEWEKKLNTARDNFLKSAKMGMSASDIMDYAKKHMDDIILQDTENKADLAAVEVFKWQILVEKNDSDKITNKRARSGANMKGLPPIRIIRPNI
jgi:hypothetical protein